MITKVLNVSEEGLKNIGESQSGKITINQKHIQIPGFFGFTCLYNAGWANFCPSFQIIFC